MKFFEDGESPLTPLMEPLEMYRQVCMYRLYRRLVPSMLGHTLQVLLDKLHTVPYVTATPCLQRLNLNFAVPRQM